MQEKTVKIGNKEVRLRTSGYTPLLYNDLFHENIFAEMTGIISAAGENGTVPFEKVPILYKLAYCMAKEADESIPGIKDWLGEFDVFDVPEIAGELIALWAADNQSRSTP